MHLLKFMIVDYEAAGMLENNVNYRVATFGRGLKSIEEDIPFLLTKRFT